MASKRLTSVQKDSELSKIKILLVATLDYYLTNPEMQIKTNNFDSSNHYKILKTQVEEHFKKRRLSLLQKWFRDLTEVFIEGSDLKFNKYLQEKTQIDIDLFDSFNKRVSNMIVRGRIISEREYYDAGIMINNLINQNNSSQKQIKALNTLLKNYEQKKKKK